MDGPCEVRYKGKVVMKGQLVNGKKEGLYVYTNLNNGQTIYGNYENDRQTGVWKYAGSKGIFCQIWYNGEDYDSLKSVYESGKPRVTYLKASPDMRSKKIFYENGNLKESSVLGKNGFHGDRLTYFPNGQLFRKEIYTEGDLKEMPCTYNPDGEEIDGGRVEGGTGKYVTYSWSDLVEKPVLQKSAIRNFKDYALDGQYMHYDSSGRLDVEGMCENAKKTGAWKYYENDHLKETKSYEGEEARDLDLHTLGSYGEYFFVETEPSMQGGVNGIPEFIVSNLKYPQKTINDAVEGKVYATFLVNSLGFKEDVRILKGLTPETDTEVLRVLRLMPRWNPGFENGVPVKVRMNLPIVFMLK